MPQAVIPATETETDLAPEFALSAWIGDDGDRGEVNLLVHHTNTPDIRKMASQSLLYGLAIMSLDARGEIAAEIDRLLSAGPLSEVDAVNQLTLLMREEP